MPTNETRKPDWYALEVEAEPDAREAVEYALMEGGSAGTETNEEFDTGLRVTGYFPTLPDRERVRLELLEALRIYDLPSSAVREMNVRAVADRDWLEEWRKNWQPVNIGRFVIAPPWSELEQSHDKVIIRIEPGMAFGTGTHETTRLCLLAIEKYFAGNTLLDVGTGTGILAIAAAKLFPEALITGCDIDAEAIRIARENAELNGVTTINFLEGSVSESTAAADLVCANLTADIIIRHLPVLTGLSCGRLILSGILETQVEVVREGLNELGLSDLEISQDGEWVAIVA